MKLPCPALPFFAAALLALPFALRAADAPPAREPLTVDAFSVVKVKVKAVADARSRSTLGGEREGTGIVIDSSGLILTIGYLVQEAESVEISAADGRAVPASVIAYDFASGFGLLRSVKAPTVKPISFGESAKIPEREPVLIVGFDGVGYRLADAMDAPFPELPPLPDAAPAAATSPSLDLSGELP